MAGFSFPDYDRVEEVTGALDAHDPTAALIQIVNLAPDL